MVTSIAAEHLSGLTHKAITHWGTTLATLGANGLKVEKIIYLIGELDQKEITRDFLAYRNEDGSGQKWLSPSEPEAWKTWKTAELLQRLKRVYPESARTYNSESVVARVRDKPLTFKSRNNFASVAKYMRSIDSILLEYEEAGLDEEQSTLVKTILKRIKDCGTKSATNAWTALTKSKHSTVEELFLALRILLNTAQQHIAKAKEFMDDSSDAGAGDSDSDAKIKKRKRNKKSSKDKRDTFNGPAQKLFKPTPTGKTGPVPRPPGSTDSVQCPKCGILGHGGDVCQLAGLNHPDLNHEEGVNWRDSKAGKKAWESYGKTNLRKHFRADGVTPWDGAKKTPEGGSQGGNKKPRYHKKSKSLSVDNIALSCNDSDSTSQDDADIAYLEELLATSSDSKQNTIPCEIVVNNHYSFFANALIDTGALQSNYVDLKIAAAIVKAQGAARELEERLMAASSAHTCASCSSNSVLNVVKCIGCHNKKFKNNEDFLIGQPGGTPKNKLLENSGDSLPRKRPPLYGDRG
ncbi:MAG: hypothetical protein P4L69_00100 [Desulfosporosinus sp.]|nr:hypothetical protein [Desulfosporosinus sp.]